MQKVYIAAMPGRVNTPPDGERTEFDRSYFVVIRVADGESALNVNELLNLPT
jgi:hypothetical protein